MSHGFSFLPTFAIGLHQRRHERLEFIPFGLREVGLLILRVDRSEEHTSELQSPCNFVCSLLLGSEEHTSELQSPCNFECRLLLGSKEHTSQLQSPCNLVCRLLLETEKHTAT